MSGPFDPSFYRVQDSIRSTGSRRSTSSTRSTQSTRRWGRFPWGVISEETFSQLGSDIEDTTDMFETRIEIYWRLSNIQWITGLVYSIVINIGIIAITTVCIIYGWPGTSDAINGFIGGLLGLILGIIMGYILSRVTFHCMLTKRLRANCEELNIRI